MATVIAKTPPQNANTASGTYLDDNLFDTLIWQHGRTVIHESAIQCPCKSTTSNQQSTCRNCAGTGWVFINKKETRMVITKVNAVTEFRDWSEKVRGMINISAIEDEKISYMDRITLLDGNSIFNEVLHFQIQDGVMFSYTVYNIKSILYCAMYVDNNNAFTRLELGIHYSIENNVVRIIDNGIKTIFTDNPELGLTIKYYHAPQYHILEMGRETMQSWRKHPGKELESLPVSATAQRAHYIADMQNLTADRIIDNSFVPDGSVTKETILIGDNSNDGGGQSVLIINTVNLITLPTVVYSFTNQTVINITHNFGRYPDVSIFDINGKQIQAKVENISTTVVRITANNSISGKVILQ